MARAPRGGGREPRALTPDDADEVFRLYLDENLTMDQIAGMMGVSRASVSRFMKAHNERFGEEAENRMNKVRFNTTRTMDRLLARVETLAETAEDLKEVAIVFAILTDKARILGNLPTQINETRQTTRTAFDDEVERLSRDLDRQSPE